MCHNGSLVTETCKKFPVKVYKYSRSFKSYHIDTAKQLLMWVAFCVKWKHKHLTFVHHRKQQIIVSY